MPYHAELAERVRELLADHDQVREIPMFGGLAFMVDERMVVCVFGADGDLLVRVAPERDAELVAAPGAQRATMGKDRSMGAGWIAVEESAFRSDDDLQHWIDIALEFHAQAPARRPRR